MDYEITIQLNPDTTIHEDSIDSFKGESIFYFVKPGNYQILYGVVDFLLLVYGAYVLLVKLMDR